MPTHRALFDLAHRLALVCACVLAAVSLGGCGVEYILEQGVGQIAMLSRREPIAEVLQEPTLDARTRDRLVLVWYARRYAKQVIGLHVGDSYHDVVRLHRDAASYVVAAAPKDSLSPHLWCFPIAGCLPYIGYFNREHAVRERAKMQALGFDVALRGVSAYSLGGWMPDPIYSPLLEESRGWVANTVIHELTHGTVFIPGRADFNEGFATYVGDRGSIAFLEQHFGVNSRTAREAREEQQDERIYNQYVDGLQARLRALYADSIPREQKLARREAIFADARQAIVHLPFRLIDAEQLARRPLNNAVLSTHATYFGLEDQLRELDRLLGWNLATLVAFVAREVPHHGDPSAFLRRWVAEHSPH